jgi:hypothetical protein
VPETPDLHLHHPDVTRDFGGDASFGDGVGSGRPSNGIINSSPTKWAILVLLFAIGAAVIGYVVFKRTRPTAPAMAVVQAPPAATAAPAPPRSGPLVEAEKIALAPLGEMDAVVRDLLVKLSSHPKVLAWLATDRLLETFTVATLNLSEGKTPTQHWAALRPKARFSVTKAPEGTTLDPRSYRRYDEFAAAINGLDPAGTARLYLTVKPRIMEAYRNLGFPEGDFDPVLERALATLLRTKPIEGNILLKEKVLTYGFADPDIEALPSAQRQLLRMGPDNMRIVQDKLRAIAVQLGLHPESVRLSGTP